MMKQELTYNGKQIHANFEHYRLNGWQSQRKGKPHKILLRRYCRSKPTFKPFSRGGKTIAMLYIFDDENNRTLVGTGEALCSMSDTFCYQTGRDLSLTRAIQRLGANHGISIGQANE